MINKSKLLSLFVVTTLLLLCSTLPVSAEIHNIVQSNESTPPQFYEVGERFADLLPSSVPVEIPLDLSVVVRDEDGIDTVIGSYKKDNDTIWTNTTMALYAELTEQRYLYSARPLNFTLDADNRNMVWDVVYYASDTLGNWNKSAQGSISYCFFPADEPTISPFENVIFVMIAIFAIVAGVGGIVIIFAVLHQRRKGTNK